MTDNDQLLQGALSGVLLVAVKQMGGTSVEANAVLTYLKRASPPLKPSEVEHQIQTALDVVRRLKMS